MMSLQWLNESWVVAHTRAVRTNCMQHRHGLAIVSSQRGCLRISAVLCWLGHLGQREAASIGIPRRKRGVERPTACGPPLVPPGPLFIEDAVEFLQGLGLLRPKQRVARRIQVQLRL